MKKPLLEGENLHSVMKTKRKGTYLGHVGFHGPALQLLLQALTPPLGLQKLVLELLELLPGDHGTALLLERLQVMRMLLGRAKPHAGTRVKQLCKKRSTRT